MDTLHFGVYLAVKLTFFIPPIIYYGYSTIYYYFLLKCTLNVFFKLSKYISFANTIVVKIVWSLQVIAVDIHKIA